MDGRINNGGARRGAGSPGAGKLNKLKQNVEKFSDIWWNKWEVMMESDDKQERIEAMREFNKLQCKMIPQDTNHNGEVLIRLVKEIAEQNEIPDEITSDNSSGQTPIQSD